MISLPEDSRDEGWHPCQRGLLTSRRVAAKSWPSRNPFAMGILVGIAISAAVSALAYRAAPTTPQLVASISCDGAAAIVARSLEEEISERERLRVTKHLRECEPCRIAIERMRTEGKLPPGAFVRMHHSSGWNSTLLASAPGR